MLKVGLVGCGAIGKVLARAIDDGRAGNVCLMMVYDRHRERAEGLISMLSSKPRLAENSDELIECKEVDLVVEAASQEAVREYASKVLSVGKDLMIMSVGALVDRGLLKEIRSLAERMGRRVYIPTGAIAGLDGLKAAMIGSVEEVTLISRKPPKALRGIDYIKEKGINLDNVREPTLIYEGPAAEACALFPTTVNVAASLSLAGIGPNETRVCILADPSTDKNIHEIHVKGDFGNLMMKVENVSLPDNPKTSRLAAFSAIATLRKLGEWIQVGT